MYRKHCNILTCDGTATRGAPSPVTPATVRCVPRWSTTGGFSSKLCAGLRLPVTSAGAVQVVLALAKVLSVVFCHLVRYHVLTLTAHSHCFHPTLSVVNDGVASVIALFASCVLLEAWLLVLVVLL